MISYERNKVSMWRLRCHSIKESPKGLSLNCTMNQKKRADGTYPKSMNISVFCSYDNCRIASDDYVGSYIDVDGNFSLGEYQKGSEYIQTFTIFAESVKKVVFD